MNLDEIIRSLESSRAPADAWSPPGRPGVYAAYLRVKTALGPLNPGMNVVLYLGTSEDLARRGIQQHLHPDRTGSSTLRRTLGAVLKRELRLKAVPRGKGNNQRDFQNYSFAPPGGARLTAWMKAKLEFGFCAGSDVARLEEQLIQRLEPVLNLQGWENPHRPFLSALRKECETEASQNQGHPGEQPGGAARRAGSTRARRPARTLFREVKLPNGVSGRLYLHSMPGRRESLDDAWAEVRRLGVFSIVCLSPLDEIRDKSPKYAEAIQTFRLPCNLRRLPVCDYQGPDDDELFCQLATQVADSLRNGDGILVHCGAGIGRTGMFTIAALMALGLSVHEARRRVETAGSSPEVPAQEETIRRVSRLLQA